MRRTLEAATGGAALACIAWSIGLQGPGGLAFVLAFGLLVVVAENTAVLVHRGTSASPGFMIVMASIAVAEGTGAAVAAAGLVGLCGGLDVHHLRDRRWGILVFNAGQFSLSAMAAAVAYVHASQLPEVVSAAAAAAAYGAVNITLVLVYVPLSTGERRRVVWRDMRPAVPNYLVFGMIGLVVGLLGLELGPVSVVLLGLPMLIGRWTFRSLHRSREAQEATVRVFTRLIEAKDRYTAGHTERVATYSVVAGHELGLRDAALEHLRLSALMHDVGKLAVPSAILNKPGRLTPEEWEVVRRHNDVGLSILGQVVFMRSMAVVASDRHGRYADDAGSTPPELLREARIVAVADAYDAMTSTRSYRQALPQDVAFDELRRNAGGQFDPDCVEALIRGLERYEMTPTHEAASAAHFATPPPVTGVGSAGLGDLLAADAG